MISYFAASGIFGIVIALFGAASIGFGFQSVLRPDSPQFLSAAKSLAVTALLVGVLGTGVGLMQAASALQVTDDLVGTTIAFQATAVAWSSIGVGAFFAAISTLVIGFGSVRQIA